MIDPGTTVDARPTNECLEEHDTRITMMLFDFSSGQTRVQTHSESSCSIKTSRVHARYPHKNSTESHEVPELVWPRQQGEWHSG
eukprot:4351273-Amphidinium_carterae.1